MKSLPIVAALAILTLFSAAAAQAGEPSATPAQPVPKTPDRAAFWYSPSTGAVGVGRGVDLTQVRKVARDSVGADDAREVLWTTSRGFAAIATFRDDRDRVQEVHARGYLTEAELALALAQAAAAKHARAPLGFARTWVGWGEEWAAGILPIHLPGGVGQLADLLPLLGLPKDLAQLGELLPSLRLPQIRLPEVRLPRIRLPFLR